MPPSFERALAITARREAEAIAAQRESSSGGAVAHPPGPPLTPEVGTARELGAAPGARLAIVGPLQTDTLIGRLAASGAGADDAEDLAIRLAEELDDGNSLGFYRQTCRRVVAGELRARVLSQAYRLSKSSTAVDRRKVFTSHIRDNSRPNVSPPSRKGSPNDQRRQTG